MITAVATGEAPPSFEESDREKAAICREYQPLPLEEVILHFRRAQQDIMMSASQVDRLRPGLAKWPRKQRDLASTRDDPPFAQPASR